MYRFSHVAVKSSDHGDSHGGSPRQSQRQSRRATPTDHIGSHGAHQQSRCQITATVTADHGDVPAGFRTCCCQGRRDFGADLALDAAEAAEIPEAAEADCTPSAATGADSAPSAAEISEDSEEDSGLSAQI